NQPIMPAQPATAVPVPNYTTVKPAAHDPLSPRAAQPASQLLPGIGGFKEESAAGTVRVQFEFPGPERIFKLQSFAGWKEQMRQESRTYEKLEKIFFPSELVLAKSPY